MNIRMKSIVPIGTTVRVYKDANREVYLDDNAEWSYFLEFMSTQDRIGRYRLFDRQGHILGENLTISDAKKRIQALTGQNS